MKNYLLLPFFFLLTSYISAQEVIDKVIAVVDNEVILKSELDYQINSLLAQRKITEDTPEIRAQLLNSLIEDKLVYAQALLDSVSASEDEVNRQIEYQINTLIQRAGSKEQLEKIYGLTLDRLKREMREHVKKNIMIEKAQEKKFGLIESSRREVEEFYATFKDSIGLMPEKVKLSHIYKNPQTSPELKERFRKRAQEILDSIKAGADFGDMARKYSDDPGSAAEGGDLGTAQRGMFYPQFEAAAYALQEKQLSGIVESPKGYHIIQLLDRSGDEIHCRHILIGFKADDEADNRVIQILIDIRDSLLAAPKLFADFAKRYSDDQETAPFGGALGTFYLEQLDKPLLDLVMKLKQSDISAPTRINFDQSRYGYHIVYLEKRTPQHKADLDIDYQEFKKLADNFKKQKLYEDWMKELKANIYWEIKDGEL